MSDLQAAPHALDVSTANTTSLLARSLPSVASTTESVPVHQDSVEMIVRTQSAAPWLTVEIEPQEMDNTVIAKRDGRESTAMSAPTILPVKL